MRSSRVLPKRCVEIFRCLGIIPLSLLVGGIHLHTRAHTRPLSRAHTHLTHDPRRTGSSTEMFPARLNSMGFGVFGCVACFELQLSVDWLFHAFGPIVSLRRRGFNRSGGGERLQTYKKVFENSIAAAKQRCCVKMSTSLGLASVGLWDPENNMNFRTRAHSVTVGLVSRTQHQVSLRTGAITPGKDSASKSLLSISLIRRY